MAENNIKISFSYEDIKQMLNNFRCDKCEYWEFSSLYNPRGHCCLQYENEDIIINSEDGCAIYTKPDFFCKSFKPLVHG